MTELSPGELRAALEPQLSEEGKRWLDESVASVAADPGAIRTLFPAAGRRTGRAPFTGREALRGWTIDDAVRAELLTALPLSSDALADEVSELYRYGDSAEKRGVLRGLTLIGTGADFGDRGLPLIHDALRTNDPRLVAAALDTYGATRVDADTYRQGVLKCVFLGIGLAGITGLDHRTDRELARMLADYARERVAAGRDVPADLWLVADHYPEVVEASGLRAELDSDVPTRREAAARALASRTPPGSHHSSSSNNPPQAREA